MVKRWRTGKDYSREGVPLSSPGARVDSGTFFLMGNTAKQIREEGWKSCWDVQERWPVHSRVLGLRLAGAIWVQVTDGRTGSSAEADPEAPLRGRPGRMHGEKGKGAAREPRCLRVWKEKRIWKGD